MPKTLATTMEAKATTPAGTMVTTTAVTILGLAMETVTVTTAIVTTLVTATTAATTTVVATTTTTSLATARPTMGERRGHPGADSLATKTTTEGAVSGTAIVPPTSSAVISSLATSAPAQQATIMVDQKTVKGTKIKSAPGQAITDNNQHNNIDKKFYVNNNHQEI